MAHYGDALDQLLGRLGDTSKPLRLSSLPELSDLHGERLDRFCAALSAFPVERRRVLLRSLQELAESSLEVSFDAIFRCCLQDTDASVRATAVEGLWEDTSPALVAPLLDLLRADPSPRVRAVAADSLGRFVLAGQLEELDTPMERRILDALLTTVRLAGEALEVRCRALESAAFADSSEVSDALELAYDQDEEDWRLSAIRGMGRSCDSRWGPILLQELTSSAVAMRYEAVVACGELGLADSVSLLGEMLRDPDRQVIEAAIWALGQIGGAEAQDLLLDTYEDADEATQAAIDDALAEAALAADTSTLALYDLDDVDDIEWLYEDESQSEGMDDDLPDSREAP